MLYRIINLTKMFYIPSIQAFLAEVRKYIPKLSPHIGVSKTVVEYFNKNPSYFKLYISSPSVKKFIKNKNKFPFNPCAHYVLKDECEICNQLSDRKLNETYERKIQELKDQLTQLRRAQLPTDEEYVSALSSINLRNIIDVKTKAYFKRSCLVDASELTTSAYLEIIAILVIALNNDLGYIPQHVTEKCELVLEKMNNMLKPHVPLTNDFRRINEF